MSKGILYDATLCIGCKMCEKACADRNGLPYDDNIAAEQKQSDHKLTVVLTNGEKFMRRLCMNCVDPTCASVCRYCMLACPFSVPKYEWGKPLPLVRKCDMCSDRLARGQQTACAEACPTGATKFGDRDELIAEAKDRLAKNPGQYVNHVFGLEEVGGTSVLLLSSVPFENFGYRTDLSSEALPLLTYRVLSHIPDLISVGAVALGGIWWLTNRKNEVAAAERQTAPSKA
jgi:formate dehydrogenase iron-sulfur subunit